MSSNVKNRIQELNNRLADTLVEKGIDASGQETTTELIEKVGQFQPGEIPNGYIKPEGSMPINENGTFDVTEKAEVNVDVPPTPWERPKDWLPYPEMSEEYDEVWQLVSVFKDHGYCFVSVNGPCTVDWGDGVVEEVANGETAHYYNFDELDEESEDITGYRQCWCRTYKPRGTLSSFIIGRYGLNGGTKSCVITTVEFVINTSNENVKSVTHSIPNIPYLRHIKILGDNEVLLSKIPNTNTSTYIEGKYRFVGANVTSLFRDINLPYNEVAYSFPESGVTSGQKVASSSVCKRMAIDCKDVTTMVNAFNGADIGELILNNTEKCTDFHGAFSAARINRISGISLANATNISSMYYHFVGVCDDPLNELCGEKLLTATSVFSGSAFFNKIPDMIIPNCTNIDAIFNSENIYEIGTLDISSVQSATDAFRMLCLRKISFIEDSIPITVNFASCQHLELDSAKSIISGLKNYSGTENEFAYTVSFHKDTRTLLENDGTTAPDGFTWIEFAQSKGWNI